MTKSNGESPTYAVEIIKKKTIYENEEINLYGLKFKMQNGNESVYDDITLSEEKIQLLSDIFANDNIDEKHIEETLCDFVDMLHSGNI